MCLSIVSVASGLCQADARTGSAVDHSFENAQTYFLKIKENPETVSRKSAIHDCASGIFIPCCSEPAMAIHNNKKSKFIFPPSSP